MDQSVYMSYMQMMGMPGQYSPMMTMPQEQLETMYPKIYFIIYPVVQHHCDMMHMTYGMTQMPTREQLQAMTDDIYAKVEAEVEVTISRESRDEGERQLFGGGRRLLRDLIAILLIRDLLRRRPYYPGYPGYYGGYSPYGPGYGNYGGYPGY